MGISGIVAYGGICRDHSGKYLGSFSINIEVENAFMVELTAVTMAIETANDKNGIIFS